jgi:hypothetical protein
LEPGSPSARRAARAQAARACRFCSVSSAFIEAEASLACTARSSQAMACVRSPAASQATPKASAMAPLEPQMSPKRAPPRAGGCRRRPRCRRRAAHEKKNVPHCERPRFDRFSANAGRRQVAGMLPRDRRHRRIEVEQPALVASEEGLHFHRHQASVTVPSWPDGYRDRTVCATWVERLLDCWPWSGDSTGTFEPQTVVTST